MYTISPLPTFDAAYSVNTTFLATHYALCSLKGGVPFSFTNLTELTYFSVEGNNLDKEAPDFALTDKDEVHVYLEDLHILFGKYRKIEEKRSAIMDQDKRTLLKCYRAMGGDIAKMKNGAGNDVTRWRGVVVEGVKVIEVHWARMGLSGPLPAR